MSTIGPRTENYLRDVILIFFAQQRLIIVVAALVAAVAAAIALLSQPVYAASGTILVRYNEFQRSPESLKDPDLKTFRVSEEDLRSEREILLSKNVVSGAIERLEQQGDFSGKPPSTGQVSSGLSVSLVPASKVLEVSLEWPSPTEAEKILDAVLNEYMEQRIKILNPANTSEFFTIQVERFRSQLDDAKNELVELATANATPDPEREITSNLDVRRSITGRITDLVTREIELEEELEYVDSVLSDGQLRLYSFINSEAMADLSRNLIELSVERGEIARTYSDEARRVAAIDKQILETSAQLRREASDHRGQIENRLDSVRRQIEALESEIERIDARNVDLQIQAIETESLKKEVELLSDSFSTFYRRREESEIPAVADESLSLFYVSILSPAHASSSPIFPNRPLIMGLGIIGGLVVGFTLGFLREFADHSFKVPRDVEQFTNQKVLFSIPVS